jgi:hypothetical protein
MTKPLFRMSQSGYCARRLSAIQLEVKEKLSPPPWLAKAAKEGVMHEQLMKKALVGLGCLVKGEQEELSEDYPTFSLLGHIDGNIELSSYALDSDEFETTFVDIHRDQVDLSLYYPLEVKSFSFMEYQRWRGDRFEAFRAYGCQSSCYMHAKHTNVMVYAVKDRSGGTKQLLVLGRPPVEFSEVQDSLTYVAECITKKTLASGEYDSSNIECRRCEFRKSLCKPEAVVVEDEDLVNILSSYVESRDLEKTAKAEKERCRDLVLAYVEQSGLGRFRAGSNIASVSWYDKEDISLKKLLQVVSREVIEDIITKSHYPRVNVTNLEEL